MGITLKTAFLAAVIFTIWGCAERQPSATAAMTPQTVAPAAAEPEVKVQVAEVQVAEVHEPVVVQVSTELQNTDCIKCHATQPADLNRNGGKHKTKVGCRKCHLEHLPLGYLTIPQCSMCHDPAVREHFTVGERKICLGCHRNPHTPLDVTIDNVPPNSIVCKTCHSEKGEEFAQFPSKHAEKNCTFCHPLKHKVINRCFTCHDKSDFHDGNAGFMVFEDCLRCHKPHSPLNIYYADETPSKLCGTCHDEQFELLSDSKAKHGQFNCAFCHKTKHPTVPNCRDCHEQPHSQALLSNFNEDCLKCHRNPHDLIF